MKERKEAMLKKKSVLDEANSIGLSTTFARACTFCANIEEADTRFSVRHYLYIIDLQWLRCLW
jgi:hypothetical protein